MNEYFVTGATVKGNVKDSLKLIESISDQIRSDFEIPRDIADDLYIKVQAVVNQLVLIYGCQELEEKI